MLYSRVLIIAAALVTLSLAPLGAGSAAAEVKIGVINVEKVLTQTEAGKAAMEKIDARGKELQSNLKAEDAQLKLLQEEIEKKSSAWSEETKQDKAMEFQKKRRELKAKVDDGRFEINSLKEKEFAPIIKALEQVIEQYGSVNGYTVILDSRMGLPYFDAAVDISDKLIVELNAVLAAQ